MDLRGPDSKRGNGQKPGLPLEHHMFRRGLHLMTGLVTVYYLVPETFFYLPRAIWLMIIIGFIPLLMEYFRLRFGKLLPGMRQHETQSVGSYAWSLWASMTLILVMPQSIAIPVIIIYSFADPVLSELRTWKKWSVFPLGFLFIWMMFFAFGFNLVLAAYGAFFMMVGESTEVLGVLRIRPELAKFYNVETDIRKWRFMFKTDDDGTTQVIPAIFLGIAYLASPSVFPGPWLFPIG